jgi:DEAD/DEAH box helicase domain-containing protein
MTDAATFSSRIREASFYQDQIEAERLLLAREADHSVAPGALHPAVRDALAGQGIERLYSHQAEAIARLRAGRSVVVVTGTASGKTLAYNLPVLEAILEDPLATALYVFPTKALAQDQLRGLEAFAPSSLVAGTYDGDTPQSRRRKLRDEGNVILTNPDMLHQGILPHHPRWARFFAHLRFVVLDEVHAYRGVFGSHLANVMRRLRRVCGHHGAEPVFACCSATIANPEEHASRICGEPVEVVDRDGSPRGPKRFLLWNPPPLGDGEEAGGERRSPLWEAVHLLAALVREGVQTIVFTRTRLAAELVMKNCRDLLRPVSRRLAERVKAYRGGYLPEERREIERALASREILGVASTNALELGIDIGSLDACVILGYPGTIASLTQQAGRAGRGRGESLVVLVARNSPVDQYLVSHSEYLFAKSPERAVVDPDNPYVVVGHISCAAHELPIGEDEADGFGGFARQVLSLLEEEGDVRALDGRWYHASSSYPAADVSLRSIAGPVVTIEDATAGADPIDSRAQGPRVIGTLDELSAMSQLHDHAVYLHGADTYIVDELDLARRIARVSRRDLDYYTQAVTVSDVRIDEKDEEGERGGSLLGFGDVTVVTTIPMFKKVRFHSRESLGFERLELPPQTLETVATWFAPPAGVVAAMRDRGLAVGDGLVGLGNVLVEVVPVFLMCDTRDIGAVTDSSQLGREALFAHDRYPGGMGYARGLLDRFEEVLDAAAAVIRECPCERGCPSCVGSAVPAFAMTDLDSAVRGRIPDKAAARFLADAVLEAGENPPDLPAKVGTAS